MYSKPDCALRFENFHFRFEFRRKEENQGVEPRRNGCGSGSSAKTGRAVANVRVSWLFPRADAAGALEVRLPAVFVAFARSGHCAAPEIPVQDGLEACCRGETSGLLECSAGLRPPR